METFLKKIKSVKCLHLPTLVVPIALFILSDLLLSAL